MVIGEVVSTGFGHSLQLVIRQIIAEVISRCFQCIVEDIIRIIHLICPKGSYEASFVKLGIVCYQWQALDVWCNFLPYIGKYRSFIGIFLR